MLVEHLKRLFGHIALRVAQDSVKGRMSIDRCALHFAVVTLYLHSHGQAGQSCCALPALKTVSQGAGRNYTALRNWYFAPAPSLRASWCE